MASKTHPAAGEIVESKVRPAAFLPSKDDPTKALQVGPQAVDMTDFEGEWYKQDEPKDSPPYGKKIVPDDQYNQTHHFKNQDHFWAGTAEQAKVAFSKSKPEDESEAKVDSGAPAV